MSQQNKTTLQSAINTQLADNTSGDISAADVRDNLINITDSLLFNSGSQTFTGELTAISFVGSLQGTATTASYVETAQTASYVENAISASYAATASTLLGSVTSASYAATASSVAGQGTINLQSGLTTTIPSFALVSSDNSNFVKFNSYAANSHQLEVDNQFSITSEFITFAGLIVGQSYNGGIFQISNGTTGQILFDSPTTVSSRLNVTGGITGSLSGSATAAISASYAATASHVPITETAADVNLLLALTDGNSLSKDQYDSITYNPANNSLTVIANSTFTGSLMVNDSIILDGKLNHGLGTTTAGNYSQASGYYSEANGNYSRAHGSSVIASADYSCAEGQSTFAGGFGSHTEGESTRTIGNFSHAEGYQVTASGNYTHAEGNNAKASGQWSHAEGTSTQAVGQSSHAEGLSSIAGGNYSHAEGTSNEATGQSSHAEGQFNLASGASAHAEGALTVALGSFSHAEGMGTIASGSGQHVGGRYNTQGDDTSLFIIGNGDVATETRSDAFKVRMSGSIVLPTTASGTPSWTGTNGEMVPGDDGAGNYVLWVYLGGNWLTGSLGI